MEQLNKLPQLYETENIPPEDKTVHLHFTVNECNWWAIEWDRRDTFFGFVILNGWNHGSEFGYFNLSDLLEIKIGGCLEVLNNPFWIPRPIKDVGLIRESLSLRQDRSGRQVT